MDKLYAIPLQKVVQVIRLFHANKIDDVAFDAGKIPIDSNKWIDYKRDYPGKKDLYYVKNREGTKVSKAIFIWICSYAPKDCYWYHPTEDSYVSNSQIGWWMPIPENEDKKT